MLIKTIISILFCGAFLFGTTPQIFAQLNDAKTTISPAEAKFNEGETARQKGELENALKLYESAIELDGDLIKAHTALISTKRTIVQRRIDADKKKGIEAAETATMQANRALTDFYQKKIAENPHTAGFYWALGRISDCCDVPNAVKFYKKSVELNPKFIEAYKGLADLAWRVGNFVENRDYQKKAFEAAPDSPERFYQYALAELLISKPNGRKLLNEIADRFPASDYAVFALGSLSDSFTDEKEKIKSLESLRKRFAGSKSTGFSYRMTVLYSVYIRTDEKKAFQLADEMLRQNPDGKDWKTNYEYVKNLLRVEQLLKSDNFTEAFNLLEKTKPIHLGIDNTSLNTLKAKAANDNATAYAILTNALISKPNEKLEKTLVEYGKKLGKNPKTVDEELWQARIAKSKPFKEFDLAVFPLEQKKKISLKSLRNKVVLVNFWFPGCRFCRDEFPYLEAMLKKYQARGFEVLGMNLVAEEENEVMPFMNQMGYKFLPIQTPGAKWGRENYGVYAAPMNFLLDGEGRIIFEPLIRDGYTAKIAEREIEMLLDRLSK